MSDARWVALGWALLVLNGAFAIYNAARLLMLFGSWDALLPTLLLAIHLFNLWVLGRALRRQGWWPR